MPTVSAMPQPETYRVVLLGSGRGSNARAVLEAEKNRQLVPARVVGLISDVADAGILALGKEYGVAAQYVDPGKFRTKLEGEGEQRYIEMIQTWQPDLIVLAGFMRVIKPGFLRAFAGRIINLHPSLLPSFKGLDGIGQAFRYGVKVTGCTVHWVNEEVDGGRILDQATVRIEDQDTEETLAGKVHAAEHWLLPRVITRLAKGEMKNEKSAT